LAIFEKFVIPLDWAKLSTKPVEIPAKTIKAQCPMAYTKRGENLKKHLTNSQEIDLFILRKIREDSLSEMWANAFTEAGNGWGRVQLPNAPALRKAFLTKQATCHTFRHSFVTQRCYE
jgi:hypothetical protein